jgi:lysophospholipase L1-like esterase
MRTFILLSLLLNFKLTAQHLRFSAVQSYVQGKQPGVEFKTDSTFYVSVDVPEGVYRVRVNLGSDEMDTFTQVKAENRRWMTEVVAVPQGNRAFRTFLVHVRTKYLPSGDTVLINPREQGKWIWDGKLTLEFNGKAPAVREIEVSRVRDVPTLFLAGNSTVVDEAHEPWSGWGQMITRFLKPEIAVANYAESGQAANTFVSSRRWAKIMTQMRPGDYVVIEFGHNDQKQKGEGKGPYTSFTSDLKILVDQTRERGAIPILVTPMHRRFFEADGKVKNTHGEYPEAVRSLAKEENVFLIDLTACSAELYESWGEEGSKKAFVHYPANTFPGQKDALADNTHFNSYGAFEIARCVVQGMKVLPLKRYLMENVEFDCQPSPYHSLLKPLGN